MFWCVSKGWAGWLSELVDREVLMCELELGGCHSSAQFANVRGGRVRKGDGGWPVCTYQAMKSLVLIFGNYERSLGKDSHIKCSKKKKKKSVTLSIVCMFSWSPSHNISILILKNFAHCSNSIVEIGTWQNSYNVKDSVPPWARLHAAGAFLD